MVADDLSNVKPDDEMLLGELSQLKREDPDIGVTRLSMALHARQPVSRTQISFRLFLFFRNV